MTLLERGIVVQYPNVRLTQATHERITRATCAKKLALLRGDDFANAYNAEINPSRPIYFVPDDTLTLAQAKVLGIETEEQLFGGVVPYAFLATKTITHPLIHADAHSPTGWSHALAQKLGQSVLPGYSAFTVADINQAVERMLKMGAVRLKPAWGIGGTGQYKITDVEEIAPILDEIGIEKIASYGVVIEQNLEEVETFSVGNVRLKDMVISYCGVQRLTKNNEDQMVYGGSRLYITRGDFPELLKRNLTPIMRDAISNAQLYDTAVSNEFPELLASRRNYDVIRGKDNEGHWRSGVLEQSWRIGGATPAEIAAFEAFQENPSLSVINTSCTEAYGVHQARHGALIYFDGIDPDVGRIIKYSNIEDNENSS